MTALKEDVYVIGESTVSRDEKGKILDKKVIARYRGNQELYDANQIDYIDIAPKQVVSIAASCIPFLENDDTTRALMGANMQRQAVPLIAPYAPIIGTGSEYKIAHDSGVTVISEVDGEVTTADANKIVITDKSDKKHTYKLTKFKKSNQDTCINQTPIVEIGQKVHEGNTLADGPAMQNGELALGRNPLIAYMT
jgi:DNA-directed RNA polymerase subunit beta